MACLPSIWVGPRTKEREREREALYTEKKKKIFAAWTDGRKRALSLDYWCGRIPRQNCISWPPSACVYRVESTGTLVYCFAHPNSLPSRIRVSASDDYLPREMLEVRTMLQAPRHSLTSQFYLPRGRRKPRTSCCPALHAYLLPFRGV